MSVRSRRRSSTLSKKALGRAAYFRRHARRIGLLHAAPGSAQQRCGFQCEAGERSKLPLQNQGEVPEDVIEQGILLVHEIIGGLPYRARAGDETFLDERSYSKTTSPPSGRHSE